MADRQKQRFITLLQWGVTIAAVWYVAREVSWRETLTLLAGVEAWILLAVALVTLLQFVMQFS